MPQDAIIIIQVEHNTYTYYITNKEKIYDSYSLIKK